MLVLVLLHVLIIAITNILVQFPFVVFGFHATWGIVSYPLIFLMTDLTVRLYSPVKARNVVLISMGPGLVISYVLANLFNHHGGINALVLWNELAFRVAVASFMAYFVGQLTDIFIFRQLSQIHQWWLAPAVSSFMGNTMDTFLFFFIAFFHSSNPFFAEHWTEIAMIDLGFKLLVSVVSLLPLYWVMLKLLHPRYKRGNSGEGIVRGQASWSS